MCTVSMVMKDWTTPGSPNYPGTLPGYPYPYPTLPPQLPTFPTPPYPYETAGSATITISPPLAQQMLDIIKRLDALDKKLGLIDCKLQEPEKKKYLKALRKVAKTKKTKPQLLTETFPKPGVGG